MDVQHILLVILSLRLGLLDLQASAVKQEEKESMPSGPRIAIIGSGIGGSSCAYYLHKLLPNAQLSIFEANDRIGGRIMSVNIEGVIVEVGAAAWASANQYIMELAKEMNLSIFDAKPKLPRTDRLDLLLNQQSALSIGVWDGYALHDIEKLVIDNLKSTAITVAEIAEFLLKLKLNYFQREDEGPFRNITEYLAYGKLTEYTSKSTLQYLSEHNVELELLKYFIEPLMIHIYDQELDMHSFAAFASLTSLLTSAHSVTSGNSKLPKALVNASKAEVHLNSKVHTITNDNTEYTIAFTHDGKNESITTVDAVVIAAPLEWTGITFKNIQPDPSSSQPHRDWVFWYVHFVVAKSINNTYFHQPDQWSAPDNIFTTANVSLPWASIQLYQPLPNSNIYKLFCTQNLTTHMDEYFIGVRSVYTHHWVYTFPRLIPITDPEDFQDIQLHDGLFNINTIESIASAMEVPVINARNVAQLIADAVNRDYGYDTYQNDC
ncbi:uncharacterized protein [Amphiura filiformis]|uniref:uncharacterized protein n=1 Tax=Amphiura filiformis TaxID=82378 RepID=UPI003B225474